MDVQELVHLRADADVAVVAVELVGGDLVHTVLVHEAERGVEVRLAGRTGDGDVVVLGRSPFTDHVVPRVEDTDAHAAVTAVDVEVAAVGERGIRVQVGVLGEPRLGGLPRIAVAEPEAAGHAVRHVLDLGGQHTVVDGVDAALAITVVNVLEGDVARVVHVDRLVDRAFLRGDQHHAEGGLRTVDRGRGRVLQDGDALDVVRVDDAQRGDLDVVQQDQRGGGTFVGTYLAADAEARVGTDLSRGDDDVQTRSGALETAGHVGDRTAVQLLRSVDRRHGAGQVGFLLRAETDDDRVLQHLGVIRQDDVYHLAAGDHDLLGLVADAGELEGAV